MNVGVGVGTTHWVLVGSGYNPDGHGVHEVCPEFGWIVPSGHAVHAMTFEMLLKVPGWQATQFPPNLYVPGSHDAANASPQMIKQERRARRICLK